MARQNSQTLGKFFLTTSRHKEAILENSMKVKKLDFSYEELKQKKAIAVRQPIPKNELSLISTYQKSYNYKISRFLQIILTND